MRFEPYNPGANHLYIHAVEASPDPSRANAAADRLRDLVPASGHLVHMPSHIDVKTGRYRLASQQNVRATRADRKYRAISPRQGFYRVYMVHNHHMLAFASMMEGRYEAALAAARDVVESVPDDYMRENAVLVDPFMGVVYDTHKRFGRWDELLREPPPPSCLLVSTAMWRFSRGLAFAAKGEIALAEQEQAAFEQARSAVPEGRLLSINPAHQVLTIAEHMLKGEIALRRGEIDESVAELRKAIELEDKLLYMEPPEWMQPVRHTLGAVLLSAGRYEEAENVYREDLAEWPDNGWSLYGLSRSLEGQKKSDEAAQVAVQLQEAWSRADAPIASSCACVPKT
jgi:Flp pilus assembly protein TadD